MCGRFKVGKVGLLLSCLVFGSMAKAQYWNEWFRQKKTQRNYLLQQIAALQAYIEVAQKGYGIVRDGLDMVSTIRDGDWKQFIDYFGSLESVNPLVRKYVRLQDIVKYNRKIMNLHGLVYKPLRISGRLNDVEVANGNVRFDGILRSCRALLGEAQDVIADDKLVMKDDERLRRIDIIYASMAANYSVAWHICESALGVAGERQLQLNELEVIKNYSE